MKEPKRIQQPLKMEAENGFDGHSNGHKTARDCLSCRRNENLTQVVKFPVTRMKKFPPVTDRLADWELLREHWMTAIETVTLEKKLQSRTEVK